jgi:AcrR family transcriptional regulator
VEHVLRVAAELLDEVGLEAFNTNLLAERAGVGLRAIYRYFPNKLAILVAMAEQLRGVERAWVGDLTQVAALGSWRLVVERSIDGYYSAASTCPGYAALSLAGQAIPELRSIEATESRALQQDLMVGLRSLGVTIDDVHLEAVCQTVIESCNVMLALALQSPPDHARRLVDELKRMIANLLADYIP